MQKFRKTLNNSLVASDIRYARRDHSVKKYIVGNYNALIGKQALRFTQKHWILSFCGVYKNQIKRSVERARTQYPNLEVEVEVDSLSELDEALESRAEYILLDNMSDEMMAEAVRRVNGRAKLEASGGITLARIPSAAKTGVDFISAGALTHSVKSSDISMDIVLN